MCRGLKTPSLVEEPSAIPPPAFDYDEMLFSVSIRDGSGKEIVSEVLCGDQLDTLKNDGHAIAATTINRFEYDQPTPLQDCLNSLIKLFHGAPRRYHLLGFFTRRLKYLGIWGRWCCYQALEC
jgi:hypothetical protein